MNDELWRFKVKKKITDKLIREAATRSRNIKWEATVWRKAKSQKEVEKWIKKELSYWKHKKGSKYTYVGYHPGKTLHTLYPYLVYRGYITKLEEKKGKRWQKMNDEERRQWVLNDEGLYNWYISSRMELYNFIQKHRKEIDKAIDNVLNPKKPKMYDDTWGVRRY